MRIWVVLATVAMAACGHDTVPSPPDASSSPHGAVVATWPGGTVTADEVREAVARLPIALRDQYNTPEGRRDFVDALVSQKLLRDEAHRQNLQLRPEIVKQVQDLEERLTTRVLLDEAEKKLGPPDEEELQQYYARHSAEFRTPLRVRVTRIMALGKHDASTRKRADGFRAQLSKTSDLAKLARTGEGPERVRDGDLGWISSATDEETTQALQLTRVGEVSPVIETSTGYSVLIATAREEPQVPPFEAVRAQVNARVVSGRQRKAFDKLIEELRQKANVQFTPGAIP